MAITLYDATIPVFTQLLASLGGVLAKGRAHSEQNGIDPDTLVDARLIDDMFPLHLQILRMTDHSQGALRDIARGAFTMPSRERRDYAGLQRLLVDAEAAVRGWSREAVDALEGREMMFDTGSSRTLFTAEAFLFGFSLPSFQFHATTAYDILRARGVPIGKMDYLGRLRTTLQH